MKKTSFISNGRDLQFTKRDLKSTITLKYHPFRKKSIARQLRDVPIRDLVGTKFRIRGEKHTCEVLSYHSGVPPRIFVRYINGDTANIPYNPHMFDIPAEVG